MIPQMPDEDRELMYNYIILTLLKNKFNKQIAVDSDIKIEKLLILISNDLRVIKKEMFDKQLKVFGYEKTSEYGNVEYTYTWRNIEAKQPYTRGRMKKHMQVKLEYYLKKLKNNQ